MRRRRDGADRLTLLTPKSMTTERPTFMPDRHSPTRLGAVPVRILTLALLTALALAFSASAADAAATHQLLGRFATQSQPRDVAVDQSTGAVYVVGSGLLRKFDADGNPASFSALGTNEIDGSTTPAAGFGDLSAIAVDVSGGANDGTIYVADQANRVIDIFSRSGTYLGQLTGNGTDEFGGPVDVTVDEAGNVYTADFPTYVSKFAASSSTLTNADFVQTIVHPGGTDAVQADDAGNVYIRSGQTLSLFNPSGMRVYNLPSTTAEGFAKLSWDPTTKRLLAANPYANEIKEYDISVPTAATVVSRFGNADLNGASGLAIEYATQRVYATSVNSDEVLIYGNLVHTAFAATHGVEGVEPTTASLKGAVNPLGLAATYVFQYGTTTSYGQSAPVAPASVGAGSVSVEASAQPSGLSPDTTYHYRLVATNAEATSYGKDQTFTTPTHLARTQPATDVQDASATLHGVGNAYGNAGGTSRFFIWSDDTPGTAAFEAQTLPAADSQVDLSVRATGLRAGTTYRYRVAVTTSAGTVYGQELTFRTAGAAPAEPGIDRVTVDDRPYGCRAPRLDAHATTVSRGELVTLTGSDLGVFGAATVAGRAAQVVSWSDRSVRLEIPADTPLGAQGVAVDCGGAGSNAIALSRQGTAGAGEGHGAQSQGRGGDGGTDACGLGRREGHGHGHEARTTHGDRTPGGHGDGAQHPDRCGQATAGPAPSPRRGRDGPLHAERGQEPDGQDDRHVRQEGGALRWPPSHAHTSCDSC